MANSVAHKDEEIATATGQIQGLNASIEGLNDMKQCVAEAEAKVQKADQGRDNCQKELARQSKAAFLQECEQTIKNRDSVIADLRNQLNSTDEKCHEFSDEINTLKCYVVDLKQMI